MYTLIITTHHRTTCVSVSTEAPPPSNMTVHAVNSTSLCVTWEAPPTVKGTLLGYLVQYREVNSKANYTVVQTSR